MITQNAKKICHAQKIETDISHNLAFERFIITRELGVIYTDYI
jgi:hypothetical protein